MHCMVKGPFTELQAFSRDLLGSLNLKAIGEILPPGSSHVAKETRTHDHQEVPDSAESEGETGKVLNWDQVYEKRAKVPSSGDPVDREAIRQLEDFSLVMDSDIFMYMQRFCAAEYQDVLRQHRVDVVDVSSEDITVLYLQPSAGVAGAVDTLQKAHLALQQLYRQLEVSLCQEKISKEGLDVDSQALRALIRELQKLYPNMLCHEDVKQLYLIGNLVDVSRAKKHIQDFSNRKGAAHRAGIPSSSQPSHPAASSTREAAPLQSKVPVGTSTSGLGLGRLELKDELKVAANFSPLKADRPQASQGLLLHQGSPPTGDRAQFSGTDALSSSDPTVLTQQDQPRVSTTGMILKSAAEFQQKDPKESDHVKGGAQLTRHRALSPFGGTRQNPGDSKDSSPSKYNSFTSMSSAFDMTKISSALDSTPTESKPLLQRSSSFSLPRSKGSNKSQCRAESGGSRVSEEMSLDSLQWSYLKDVCSSALDELCRDGVVQISERRTGNCTVLTLQAEDRNKLSQAKWKVEALVQKCPDLVCQTVSYSELAVDGRDDSDLSDLCSFLRGNSLQVGLSKDKYKLSLVCPREMLPGVTEAVQLFSSRRLNAPRPESTGHSNVTQPSRHQDTKLDAAPPDSLETLQMDLQHLSIGDKAGQEDVLRAFQLQEAEEKRSPSPWRFQQTLGQEEANDHVNCGAVQGGCSPLSPSAVDKPGPADLRDSQEQPKRKLSVGEPDIARLKQVLPDRFQFARDKSRGGHHEAMGQLQSAAPAGPQSLPTRLHRAAAEQPPAAEPMGQQKARSTIQEEPELSSQQTRGSSLGQESSKTPLGPRDACQSLGVTCQAPCGCALSRSCSAVDTAQPACCSSSLLVPSCKIPGTFKIFPRSQSLPGFYRDLTLQVTYSIPDGVQGVGDPHPGQPYKGGDFCAFLPDNKEGQKIAVLLKKAFDHGLIFQIKSCNGEERVTWGLVPHKTSWGGGKARNGYPDAQYLQEVCRVLKKLGIS
ncbi:uncharacterized protein [Heliangelus exortis]